MNTQITFTVRGQMTPFTMEVQQHNVTIEQAKQIVKAKLAQHNVTFRGAPATFHIVSVIAK